MKFYHPQVQLVRDRNLTGPHTFSMHVVTFCPQTNLKADGHSIQTDGDYMEITLFIKEYPELPKYNYITPIVHTLELGSFPSGNNEGDFEVLVRLRSDLMTRDAADEDKPKGQSTTGSASSAEGERPVD